LRFCTPGLPLTITRTRPHRDPIIFERLNASSSVCTRFRDLPPIFALFHLFFNSFLSLLTIFSTVFKLYYVYSSNLNRFRDSPLIFEINRPFLPIFTHFRHFDSFIHIFDSFLLFSNHFTHLDIVHNHSHSFLNTHHLFLTHNTSF
jgi:hypothetical protein